MLAFDEDEESIYIQYFDGELDKLEKDDLGYEEL